MFIILLGRYDTEIEVEDISENIGDDTASEQYNKEETAKLHYLEGRIYSDIGEKKILAIINEWLSEFKDRHDVLYQYLKKSLIRFFTDNKLNFKIENDRIVKKIPIIEIELIENGLHSFMKGTVYLGNFIDNREKLAFKDAVVSTHHGIELLAKSLLIDHNELLIYDNLTEYREKIEQTKNNPETTKQISFHTISYSEALKRIRTFLNQIEIDEKLISNLDDLNYVRNNIEHFALKVNVKPYIFKLINIQIKMLEIFKYAIPSFSKHFHSLMDDDSKLKSEYYDALNQTRKYSTEEKEEDEQKELITLPKEILTDLPTSPDEKIDEFQVFYILVKRFSLESITEEDLQEIIKELIEIIRTYTAMTEWNEKETIIKELRKNFKLKTRSVVSPEKDLNQITDVFMDLVTSIY